MNVQEYWGQHPPPVVGLPCAEANENSVAGNSGDLTEQAILHRLDAGTLS